MARLPVNAPEGFEYAQRLSGWRLAGDTLFASSRLSSGREAEIEISCVGEGVWRVVFSPGGGVLPELPILERAPAPLGLSVSETTEQLLARCGGYTLAIERDPWCLSLLDVAGRTICRENPYDVDGLNRPFILPLGCVNDPIHGASQVVESFHLRPQEQLFGLGEKFTQLDKTGQRIVSWNLDALGAASERAYKNVPFLLSSQGYGIFLNTGRRCTFDLGTASCETYTLKIDGPYLDLFLIAGATPAELLKKYTSLTGRAPVPPKWSFGLWLSGSGVYRDERGIRKLAEGVEQRDLPCDVLHIDPWWMHWRRYADFQWDRQAFPEPGKLISDLHASGLHLSLWQHPYISIESELFEEGVQKGYFARTSAGEPYVIDYGLSLSTLPGGVTQVAEENNSWNARVAIIDLTHPGAVEWYKALMRPVLQLGVDVFKTDFGEDIPEDACFSGGMTGAEMHNLYSLLYNQAVFEVTEEVKGQGLVWARSAWAGSQRYPACWSGDPASQWDSLAFTLRGGLSLGLSGMPFWSHDVGGYRGRPSEALYIRWAQLGAFSSHIRCHGESEREPWYYGEQAVEIFRQYLKLRYELFPYLYSCAHEASLTGLPVLRAMLLEFPDDPIAYSQDLQYMFGPWLLVAPIYTEEVGRSLYLPPGDWFDFWTGERQRGPAVLAANPPLERMPLFVRAGAVIPHMRPANRIPSGIIDPLILDIYPTEAIHYLFYEDEGATEFSGQYDDGERSLQLRWEGPVERAFVLNLHLGWQPAKLALRAGGQEIQVPEFEAQPGSPGQPGAPASAWPLPPTDPVQLRIPACRAASIELKGSVDG